MHFFPWSKASTRHYNNEFGRPNLCGYFRVYQQQVNNHIYGYHKPIMLAGGIGNIRANQMKKQVIPQGAYIIVLGGPAMLIGIGGGAASSMGSGTVNEDLDFTSVQRHNPEMQRRCQEVKVSAHILSCDMPACTSVRMCAARLQTCASGIICLGCESLYLALSACARTHSTPAHAHGFCTTAS